MSTHQYESLRAILDKIIEIQGFGTQVELSEVLGVGYSVPYRWGANGLPEGRVEQLFLLGKELIPEAEIRRFVREKKVGRLDPSEMEPESRALFEKLMDLCTTDFSGAKKLTRLAESIGVTSVSLYNWIHQGEVPPAKARVLASMSCGKYRESDFNPVFEGLVRDGGVPDEVDAKEFADTMGCDIGYALAKAARNVVASGKGEKAFDRSARLNYGVVISKLIGKKPVYVYKWSRVGIVPTAYCRLIARLAKVPIAKLNPVFAGMQPEEAA